MDRPWGRPFFRFLPRLFLFPAFSAFGPGPALAQGAVAGCAGPRHLQKETRECKYDVSYPSLPQPRVECEARRWIDGEMEKFDREMPLPRRGHKNEFWVTYGTCRSGETRSVVLQNYRYAQGAHGLTTVKTFTFDGKTGKLYGLFDVLNPQKDWFKAIFPFLQKRAAELKVEFFPEEKGKARSDFNSFALDRGDLVLYFNQCALCPCYAGIVKVPIPMGAVRDILQPPFNRERGR